jgi:hypothetical protein
MPVGRSDYEDRKEEKIDRALNRAAKARTEAVAQRTKAYELADGIPFGQPILVGHHSEKRHRAHIKKIEAAQDKTVHAMDKAKYYEGKAEATANNDSISGDNPEAVNLYKEKLAELEKRQEFMKSVNAYWRKHKTMKGCPGYSDQMAMIVDTEMKTAYSWVQKSGPFESWRLSNNSAEIRRIKEKLETLENLDGMAAEIIKFPGGEMRVDVDINRVQFIFDDKPSDEKRSLLKHNGFKWAPSQGAWQRQRTLVAIRIAKSLISKLEENKQ